MRGIVVVGVAGIWLVAAVACGDSSSSDGPADAGGGGDAIAARDGDGEREGSADAGPDVFDAGPTIYTVKIHVSTTSDTFSRGGPVTPTWAVRLGDDGKTWESFASGDAGADAGTTAPGEYTIVTEAKSYAVAFACADDARSEVSVLTRATDIGDLDVVFGPQCAASSTETTDLTGTFSGLGAATGWMDFGYAFDTRGAVLPTSGGKGDYELVNLVSGTGDLAFGFRDDSGEPITRIFIARDASLPKGTAKLDANVGMLGFTPGSQKLALTNLNDEQTHVSVLYTMGGATTGLEIGPANDPTGAATANVGYPTVPASSQKSGDRYRVSAVTIGATSNRGGTAVFHDAADFAIDLPPAVDAPAGSLLDERVVTKMKTRGGADVYEATVFTRISNQSDRTWHVSTSASLVTSASPGSDIELTPPDFTSAAGFKSEWLTPTGLDHTVTAAVYEKQSTVGDGKITRFAQRSITMDKE